MKQASVSATAILSGGNYLKFDLYSFSLTTGVSYYFTAGDVSLTAAVYPSGTTNPYLMGYTFSRGATTQAVGLDAQELDLTIAPAFDNPGGPPLIGGYSLMQASRLGLLDNASVLYSKIFLNYPVANGQLDTSPAAIAWFRGVVAEQDVQRFSLKMKISSDLIVLNQVQMPKNLAQAPCSHTVYDAGCTLSKSTFTSTGTIAAAVSTSSFNTSLTQADGYFDLGVIQFTSGANAGYSSTIKKYLHASGNIQVVIPFPAPVAPTDAFSVYPGDDRLLSTCTNKFANRAHFKGIPFTPVPETLYDGRTSSPQGGSFGHPPGGSGPGGRNQK